VPDVSVIIPTYNRRSFLKEAVASCFAENDPLDFEVVLVDDGSTDGTREWLAQLDEPRIRPIFQEHRGAQQARNAGLEAAEGNAIKFLDSDDYLYPGVLREQYEAIRETGADVCYGPIDIIDEDGEIRGHKSNAAVEDLLGGVATGGVTTYPHVFLFRAEVARREQWRPEVPFHQDTAYVLDVATHDPEIFRSETTVGVHHAHQGDRITTTTKAESSIQNIEYKFDLLYRAFWNRRKHTGASSKLKHDVAHGLWQEAHKLGPANFSKFEDRWSRVEEIQPEYSPPRSNTLLTVIDQFWGTLTTERLINPLRRIKFEIKGGAAGK